MGTQRRVTRGVCERLDFACVRASAIYVRLRRAVADIYVVIQAYTHHLSERSMTRYGVMPSIYLARGAPRRCAWRHIRVLTSIKVHTAHTPTDGGLSYRLIRFWNFSNKRHPCHTHEHYTREHCAAVNAIAGSSTYLVSSLVTHPPPTHTTLRCL